MNARRYPRTLQEAFGPYTSREVHPMPAAPSRTERMLGAMMAVVIGVLLAAALVHWWAA